MGISLVSLSSSEAPKFAATHDRCSCQEIEGRFGLSLPSCFQLDQHVYVCVYGGRHAYV